MSYLYYNMFEYSEDNSDSDNSNSAFTQKNYNQSLNVKSSDDIKSDEDFLENTNIVSYNDYNTKIQTQSSSNFISCDDNKQDDKTQKQEQLLSADDIEEIKELICNWLELDDKTKELSDQIKDLKSEKKQYETYILAFMDKANKEVIKSKDNTCTLRKEVKETKGSLKEEHILKTLSVILQNSEQAYKITQKIIEELPSKETISLKKEKNQKPTKKTKKSTKKDI